MSVSHALAQGIFLPAGGPVHRSMGGASTATSIDAIGSLYWNPATIAGFERSELEVGIDVLFADTDVASSIVGLGAGSTDSDLSGIPIPNVGWVHRTCNPDVTFGLGVLTVAGFQTNYPGSLTNPILTPQSNAVGIPGGLGRVSGDAQFVEMTPVLAWQVTDDVAVSIGPTVTIGRVLASPFPFAGVDDADGSGVPRYASSTSSRFHYGVGAQIGVLYTGIPTLDLGASLKSPQFMEQFRLQSQDELGRPRFLKLDLDLPMIASVGAAWHGIPDTVISADVRYFDYRNTQGFGESGFNPDGSLKGLGWRNTFSFAAGARRRMCHCLSLGAGYQFNPSPIEATDVTANIASPLIQEHQLSLGSTLHLSESVDLNMAWSHAFRAERTGAITTAAGTIPGSSIRSGVSADVITAGVTVHY